jgi:hypothetical protein
MSYSQTLNVMQIYKKWRNKQVNKPAASMRLEAFRVENTETAVF